MIAINYAFIRLTRVIKSPNADTLIKASLAAYLDFGRSGGIFGGLPLGIVEVGRHGDDSSVQRATKEGFCHILHLAQQQLCNLLRRNSCLHSQRVNCTKPKRFTQCDKKTIYTNALWDACVSQHHSDKQDTGCLLQGMCMSRCRKVTGWLEREKQAQAEPAG